MGVGEEEVYVLFLNATLNIDRLRQVQNRFLMPLDFKKKLNSKWPMSEILGGKHVTEYHLEKKLF